MAPDGQKEATSRTGGDRDQAMEPRHRARKAVQFDYAGGARLPKNTQQRAGHERMRQQGRAEKVEGDRARQVVLDCAAFEDAA